MSRLVIDASVALKWFLRDEKYGERALGLLDRFVRGELELVAPSLMVYEVINGLVIAQRKGRIAEEKVLSAITGFLDLGLTFVELTGLEARVLHFCRTYDRSAYDASYLAVAEKASLTLMTGDERLYNSVKVKTGWVKWIGDAAKGQEEGTRDQGVGTAAERQEKDSGQVTRWPSGNAAERQEKDSGQVPGGRVAMPRSGKKKGRGTRG